MWILWRLDFDYVGTKIMGLLVYDLMAFSMDMWRGGGDWWFVGVRWQWQVRSL